MGGGGWGGANFQSGGKLHENKEFGTRGVSLAPPPRSTKGILPSSLSLTPYLPAPEKDSLHEQDLDMIYPTPPPQRGPR